MSTPVLAASALGLSRNEARRRFSHVETAEALEDLRQEIVAALTGADWERPWRIYDLEDLSAVETIHLVEQGLMTPTFADGVG
jgi:hypothetical protein